MTLLLPTLALLAPVGPAGAADDPAARHPAGSVLYLEIPDVPAALEAYGRTALIATLTDPELHAAIGAVIDEEFDPLALLEAEYRGALERGDIPPLKELVLDPLRGLSLSVSAPGGRVLPLVLGAVSGAVEPAELLAQLGLQLELELTDAAAAGALIELLEQMAEAGGDTFVVEERGTARVVRVESEDPIERLLTLVQDGPRLCVLFGAPGPDAYLARSTGDEAGFDAPRPALFTGRGTTVLRYHASFPSELLSLPELAQVGPLIELAEGLVGTPVSMLVRGGQWRVGIEDSGRFVTEGLHPRPTGALDRVLGSQPLDRSAFDLLHPDAIVGWATHFDREPLLALIEAQLADLADDPMAQLEQAYGFRPDRDLLAPLGPALAYSLPEPQTLLAAPPLMIAAALSDRTAFVRGMDGLGRFLVEWTGGDFELETSEYRGMRLYALNIDWRAVGLPAGIPIDPSAFFKPTLAVCDDRVFLTTQPSHAKHEIRRLVSQDTAPNPIAAEFPAGCTTVGFADWMRFVGKLYTAGRAMAALIAISSGEELPFDPNALPEADLITKRFVPSRRWKQLVGEGGEQVLHFQESSFGPEFPILIGVGIGAVAFAFGDELVAVPPGPPVDVAVAWPEDAGPEWHLALARATQLQVASQVFQHDQGRWPRDLAELEAGTANYPAGYLQGGGVGQDPWGGDYHLRVEGQRASVWSDGPNGVDEGGGGDDVVAR